MEKRMIVYVEEMSGVAAKTGKPYMFHNVYMVRLGVGERVSNRGAMTCRSVGSEPVKYRCEKAQFEAVVEVPGVYEVELEERASAEGTCEMVVVAVRHPAPAMTNGGVAKPAAVPVGAAVKV